MNSANLINTLAGKTGGYAVTTVHSMPWLSTPIQQKKTKGQKKRGQPVIINPIFEECGMIVEDPFWKSVFTQASCGKFPRGFMFRNDILTYRKGTKTQKIELSGSATENISLFTKFLRDTAGIRSQADQDRDRRQLEQKVSRMKTIENCTWSDIKKKKVKAMLINEYVDVLTKELALTDE